MKKNDRPQRLLKTSSPAPLRPTDHRDAHVGTCCSPGRRRSRPHHTTIPVYRRRQVAQAARPLPRRPSVHPSSPARRYDRTGRQPATYELPANEHGGLQSRRTGDRYVSVAQLSESTQARSFGMTAEYGVKAGMAAIAQAASSTPCLFYFVRRVINSANGHQVVPASCRLASQAGALLRACGAETSALDPPATGAYGRPARRPFGGGISAGSVRTAGGRPWDYISTLNQYGRSGNLRLPARYRRRRFITATYAAGDALTRSTTGRWPASAAVGLPGPRATGPHHHRGSPVQHHPSCPPPRRGVA